ncbi:MAG: tetratricopeptide repeat protein [bacterium]
MAITIVWIFIIISLGVIGAIVFRKFTVLASIDVENIEAEKQAAVKRRIISEKFQRNVNKWIIRIWRIIKPVLKLLNRFFSFIYKKLLDSKSKYSQTDLQPGQNVDQQVEGLFAQAQDLVHKEELAEAENKYIEIIGLDSKNFKAFQLLGELYLYRQNYQEAEQTLQHAVKLKTSNGGDAPELANVYFDLSYVYEAQKDHAEAVDNMKKALKIDSNNPRYLNKMIELCIMIDNKGDAYDACKKLEKVNPDNKKLKELKQRVTDM